MSVSEYKHVKQSSRTRVACLLVIFVSLWGLALTSRDVHAMNPEQMASLPGTELLDMRVDGVFRKCGLPAMIDDAAGAALKRQTQRWGDARMNLSAKQWTVHYSESGAGEHTGNGWRNPKAGSATCLTGLSALMLHAKGEAGILTVTKRPDNNGYTTTYHVPEDLFNAHQIVGIEGSWKQGRPVSQLHSVFGVPDEVIDETGPTSIHRYWIVRSENKMPMAAYAIDFVITNTANTCRNYAVYTSGTGFVQEKLDNLIRQWERVYVLD